MAIILLQEKQPGIVHRILLCAVFYPEEFITKDLYSCGRYSDSYTIDNILVSKSALSRCFIETLTILDITQMYTKEQLKQLSDHCPVIVQFDVSAPDND